MKNFKQKITVGVTLGVIALGTAFLGNACSGFNPFNEDTSSTADAGSCGDGITLEVKRNTKTVSLIYGEQVLETYRSCLGLKEISAESELTFEDITFADGSGEKSTVADLSAPMSLGYVRFADTLCRDLWAQEGSAGEDRIRYASIPVNGPIGPGQIADTAKRFALSCWGRNLDPTEEDLFVDYVQGIYDRDNGNAQQRNFNTGIAICVATLASLQGIQL